MQDNRIDILHIQILERAVERLGDLLGDGKFWVIWEGLGRILSIYTCVPGLQEQISSPFASPSHMRCQQDRVK